LKSLFLRSWKNYESHSRSGRKSQKERKKERKKGVGKGKFVSGFWMLVLLVAA